MTLQAVLPSAFHLNLRRLSIQSFPMNTVLPNSVCGCLNLVALIITGKSARSGLKGPLPTCLTRLLNLRYLMLTRHSLVGSVPALPLNALVEVRLSNNKLTGTFPSVAGPHVQKININHNEFLAIPRLSNCPQLRFLAVWINSVVHGCQFESLAGCLRQITTRSAHLWQRFFHTVPLGTQHLLR